VLIVGKTVSEDLEHEIRQGLERGDAAGAAALIVRGYGAELCGYLLARHRDEGDAAEVFARFSERLVRALPSFRSESSARTWAYALARHASLTYRRDARRLDRKQAPLPEGSALSALAEPSRPETAPYLRTEGRARLAALRAALSPDDQELLVLRVDRGLSWNDLALVLGDAAAPPTGDELQRSAARLRKRFQLLIKRLRQRARETGALGEERP
jgi:RNA polymerase sigma-70 factor, ECF subfamily